MSFLRLTCLRFLKIYSQVFWPLVFQLVKVPGFTSMFKNKIGFGFAINVSLAIEPTLCYPSTTKYRKIPSPVLCLLVALNFPDFSLMTHEPWDHSCGRAGRPSRTAMEDKGHGRSVPSACPRGPGCLWHLSGDMLTFLIWFLLEASVSSRVTGEHRENVSDHMPNY